ncbi:peptidase inhibitor family I36 protein [Galbitalea sp. SE-J8]|uniref:peptidase inhibitor family I36 protein n=1 Tax=Galbitalea sp. SE-J8 TaxID=3054952 RepID=UPI00259D18CC|nr:peptidase inhibitor family I36 protein [Galbitalea sp. SE-J8]MDM4764421.1 peptidase inhibitor family I36 protein [Galbitalea sp. SE-J8]
MKKKLIAVAGFAVALAGTVATAGPALATTSGTCVDTKVCVYKEVSYAGSQYSMDGYQTTSQITSSLVNETDSWKNRTNYTSFDLIDAADIFHAEALLNTLGANTNKADLGAKINKADFIRRT